MIDVWLSSFALSALICMPSCRGVGRLQHQEPLFSHVAPLFHVAPVSKVTALGPDYLSDDRLCPALDLKPLNTDHLRIAVLDAVEGVDGRVQRTFNLGGRVGSRHSRSILSSPRQPAEEIAGRRVETGDLYRE